MMMMMLLFKIIFLYCFEPMVLFQSINQNKTNTMCTIDDYVYIYIDYTNQYTYDIYTHSPHIYVVLVAF